jgi:hypothetical protein
MVTAIALSQSQVSLLSGHADGAVCMWRVYISSQDRNRPPLGAAPHATFIAHAGPVVSLAVNTGVGIAASLAKDLRAADAGSLAIYCTRKGRFVRSVSFSLDLLIAAMPPELATAVRVPIPIAASGEQPTAPLLDMQHLTICPDGNIVVYGVVQDRLPILALYSITGTLLHVRPTGTYLNSLCATPYQLRSPKKDLGFVVTAGQDCTVTFRTTFDLAPVQTFYCDGRHHQTAPHPNGLELFQSTFPSAAPTARPVGIAAVDVTPNAQHMLVSVHPMAGSLDHDEREGRLLLFALPHSDQDGALGFSVDSSALFPGAPQKSVGAVGKAVLGKIDDLSVAVGAKGLELANSTVKGAKTRLSGMFGSIFSKKGEKGEKGDKGVKGEKSGSENDSKQNL